MKNESSKEWVHGNQVYMWIENENLLKISWMNTNLSDKEKVSLLTEQFDYKSKEKVEYLLKKKVLEKIKLTVEKRFETSYTDIMLKIITFYNKEELKPMFGKQNDYDSYDNWLRICLEKEIIAYEKKHGAFI